MLNKDEKFLRLLAFVDDDYRRFVSLFVDPVIKPYSDTEKQFSNFGCSTCRENFKKHLESETAKESIALRVYLSNVDDTISELRRKIIIEMLNIVEFLYTNCSTCGIDKNLRWKSDAHEKVDISDTKKYNNDIVRQNILKYGEALDVYDLANFLWRTSQVNPETRLDCMFRVMPIIEKEECRQCGSKNNLEIHHEIPNYIISKSVVNEMPDAPMLIWRIRTMKKQFVYFEKIVTLCRDCHKEIHSSQNEDCYASSYSLRNITLRNDLVPLSRKNRSQLHAERTRKKIIKIFKNRRDKEGRCVFYGMEDKKRLADVIEYRNAYGRINRSFSKLNEYFEIHNLPFILKEIDITTEYKGERKRFRAAWELIPL